MFYFVSSTLARMACAVDWALKKRRLRSFFPFFTLFVFFHSVIPLCPVLVPVSVWFPSLYSKLKAMMILDNNSECFTQRFSDAAWLVCSSLSCYFPSSNCLPLFILRVGFACILGFFLFYLLLLCFCCLFCFFPAGRRGWGGGSCLPPKYLVVSSFAYVLTKVNKKVTCTDLTFERSKPPKRLKRTLILIGQLCSGYTFLKQETDR